MQWRAPNGFEAKWREVIDREGSLYYSFLIYVASFPLPK